MNYGDSDAAALGGMTGELSALSRNGDLLPFSGIADMVGRADGAGPVENSPYSDGAH
jgi:hypothetical protein